MQKKNMVKDAIRILDSRGFESVQLGNVRSCFDIVARKKGRMLLFKIVENIDSIDERTAHSVAMLTNFFSTSAFAVGSGYKGSRLEEGIAFARHGISCISLETMERVIDGESPANAERFIGAKYRINGHSLREVREKSRTSIRELSEATGISADSIYRYESSSPYVSLSNWRKLEQFFNGKIRSLPAGVPEKVVDRKSGERIEESHGISLIKMDSGPFNMIGKMKLRYEVGQITDRRTSRKRAEIYARIHTLTGKDFPFFISDKASIENVFGIPVVSRRELQQLSGEKELKEKLTARATIY
ncbi:MAG: helix-turn-helix domain-containing protein [Candidatus Marsarchaeota archaeon]|nr:helix-turn-helix domain-containing protein [Candidatus Marsarchaeota archaeon]